MYSILFDPLADQDLKKLEKHQALRILHTIDKKLKVAPHEYEKPLIGVLKGWRSLKINSYRVVYQVQENIIQVLILAIGQRKDDIIYAEATRRIKK